MSDGFEKKAFHGGARERRLKLRFRIEQNVQYKMLYGPRMSETGSGRTMNISSSGVCFTTTAPLAPGMPVELSMTWPALLNQKCPMKLMIYGCVVRSDAESAAVVIERYEFRTQGLRVFQPPMVPTTRAEAFLPS